MADHQLQQLKEQQCKANRNQQRAKQIGQEDAIHIVGIQPKNRIDAEQNEICRRHKISLN